MKIKLQSQGFSLSPAIDTHVRTQLQFHLANFERDVISAEVFLNDINGPKGGPDKKVTICTRLSSRATVTVEKTRGDLYAAVTQAARQTKRAVRRSLSKHRRMEKLAIRQMRYQAQG